VRRESDIIQESEGTGDNDNKKGMTSSESRRRIIVSIVPVNHYLRKNRFPTVPAEFL
jgi:hypothetical protein